MLPSLNATFLPYNSPPRQVAPVAVGSFGLIGDDTPPTPPEATPASADVSTPPEATTWIKQVFQQCRAILISLASLFKANLTPEDIVKPTTESSSHLTPRT